jgi:hypothetical protein
MKHKQSKRIILALGLFAPKIGDKSVTRGIDGVVAAARANFPDSCDEIITIRSLSDFEKGFKWLSDDLPEEFAQGKFRGIASGYYVQEALEGEHGVTDIHYDLTGVDNAKNPTHAGSELRSLIAHLKTVHPRKVNIHFASEKCLSTIEKNATRCVGAPLPLWLQKHLSDFVQEG